MTWTHRFRRQSISIIMFWLTVSQSALVADDVRFEIPGKIMVIAAKARIMQGEEHVGSVTAGEVLKASQEKELWLGLPDKAGWILKKDVAPIDQAIATFTKILNKSNSSTAYFHRGIAYLTLNKPAEAIKDFNSAIKKDSKRGTFYTSRGLAFQKLGKTDDAYADFSHAIKLNSKDANAYYNRSVLYTAQKNLKKAMDDLNSSIAAYQKYAPAYNNRGILWRMQGEYSKAIEDYTQAIKLNPQYAAAFANRGYAYKKSGKYDSARNDYENSIAIDPDAAAPRNDYAWLLATNPGQKFRNGKLALKHARQACRVWQNKNIDGLDTLAAAYAETGNFEYAIETIDEALKIAPSAAKESLAEKRKLYAAGQPYREK